MANRRLRALQVFGLALISVFAAEARAGNSADLVVHIFDSPDPIGPDSNLNYEILFANDGPADATDVTVSTGLFSPFVTFMSLSAPAGWTCTTPAVGAGGSIRCSVPSLAVEDTGNIRLVARVEFGASSAFTTATIAASTPDPFPGNNTVSADTLVAPSTDVSITKTAAAGTVTNEGESARDSSEGTRA